MVRRFLLFAVSLGAALTATYLVAVRPLWKHWGVDPAEAERALPGDDLVPEPTAFDTRGLTIAAPPSAVWPWLVQMGYGRAGWYSYDAVDTSRKSVVEIHPEWQSLAVGDTDPDRSARRLPGQGDRAGEGARALLRHRAHEGAADRGRRGRRADRPAEPARHRQGAGHDDAARVLHQLGLRARADRRGRDPSHRALPPLGRDDRSSRRLHGQGARAGHLHHGAQADAGHPGACRARRSRVARADLVRDDDGPHARRRARARRAPPVEPESVKHEEPEIRVKVKVHDLESKPEPTPESSTPEPTEAEPAKA